MKQRCYRWIGIDLTGTLQQGFLWGHQRTEIIMQLRQSNIICQQVRLHRQAFRHSLFLSQTRSITQFTEQLGAMLAANVPLLMALQLIKENVTHKHLCQLNEALQQQLEQGMSLAQALKHHPIYFDEIYCHMISIGEKTGRLTEICQQLAEERHKQALLRYQFKKALTYPCITLVFALCTSYGLLAHVVPQFAQLFQQWHTPLPIMTQMLIHTAHAIQQYGVKLFSCICFLGLMIKIIRTHHPVWKQRLDRWILQIPSVGPLKKRFLLIRLMRMLAMTLEAGIPLLEGLQLVTPISHNDEVKYQLQQLIERIYHGYTLHAAMVQTNLFSQFLQQMVYLGEESGTLEKAFKTFVQTEEQRLAQSIAQCQQWLEPIILLGLGGLIAGLILALYLPIFSLGHFL